MQQHLKNLENWLDIQYKKLPSFPKGFKDFLVDIAPWLSLLAGILSLWGAWRLWDWATNSLVRWYTGSDWSVTIWLGVLIASVIGVLYLMAFSQLQDRKKSGWNLIFYALLLNLAYGLAASFITGYGSFGSFLSSLIGTAISLYFLFQIRERYTGAKSTKPAKPAKT